MSSWETSSSESNDFFKTLVCGKNFLIETIGADRDSEGANYMEVKGKSCIIHKGWYRI